MGMQLKELVALIFDCQATNANPDKGHLLEVAWGTTAAGFPENFLVLKDTSG